MLDEIRRSATEVIKLYSETSESIIQREKEIEIRKTASFLSGDKPTKKQRREIINFKRKDDD